MTKSGGRGSAWKRTARRRRMACCLCFWLREKRFGGLPWGKGLGSKIERDEGALLGYRVAEIGTRSFTAVMLSMMEAVSQAARPEGIVLQELDPIWKEAMQRLEAEASAKAAAGDLP